MAKPAKGFLTEDGQFFETEPEADRETLTQQIHQWCESHKIESSKVFQIIHSIGTQIKVYLDADSNCHDPRAAPYSPIPQTHPSDEA